MRRVVVTGIGVVSAIGNNAGEFARSLAEGKAGIGPLTKFSPEQIRMKVGAEVSGFRAADHFDERSLGWLDPFSHFGIAAAREAIADSGIEFTEELGERSGAVTGSCLGGKETEDDLYRELYEKNRSRFPPTVIPAVMANSVASHVAMENGLTGATFTLSTACSSANHAIGNAFWLVRQGTLDAVVTGGSEAPFALGNIKAWEAMRVVSPDTCRPFSKDRSGMVLGEGAAMFVIEELEHARARGAKIYAEIAGFGMSADAHHLTMPLVAGAAKAMSAALDDARMPPEKIGYINAHGTATQANDAMESAAIRTVFGERTDEIYVSSTKSMHGHALGAAGALEAAATALALHTGVLPPNINFNEPDPECDINVIRNTAIEARPEAAMSNSFAFGGLNAVLAFKRSPE